MIVKCAGCKGTFNVHPENFENHEVVFCPICELSHKITKANSKVTVKPLLNA